MSKRSGLPGNAARPGEGEGRLRPTLAQGVVPELQESPCAGVRWPSAIAWPTRIARARCAACSVKIARDLSSGTAVLVETTLLEERDEVVDVGPRHVDAACSADPSCSISKRPRTTLQPSFSSPILQSEGTTTSVRNSSQKSDSLLIC